MITNTTRQQFENENELRKYPISELATCVDDNGNDLPYCILSGIVVVSTVKLLNIRLSSIYIGPEVVSATLSDDVGAVAVFMSGRKNLSNDMTMESMRQGVAARVSFGDLSSVGVLSLRFSSSKQSKLHEFCLFEFRDTGVVSFVDDMSGNKATGEVALSFSQGVDAVVEQGTNGAVIRTSLSSGLIKSLSDGCDPTDLNKSCIAPVIQTINGIAPDESGKIAIILE